MAKAHIFIQKDYWYICFANILLNDNMRCQIDFFLLKTRSLKMSIALIKSLKIPIPTLAKSAWIYCFLSMNKRGRIFFILLLSGKTQKSINIFPEAP